MSALLEALLDAERRAEVARHDEKMMRENALVRAGTWPELGGNPDPVKGQAIADSVRRGGGSLPALTDADQARHDEHQRAETRRILAGEPYIWPQVAWRSEAPARRRGEPRSSRFGELQ